MAEAWDTALAGSLRPSSAILELAQQRKRAGEPVAFTAVTLNEVMHGLHKAGASGRTAAYEQARWLNDQLDAGLVTVLPLDRRAADVAGALRSRMPTPPSNPKRGRGRSKPESRVAWILDLYTAATAFVHGYDLVSADAHHTGIAARLRELAPGAPPLTVRLPQPL
ncbi:MAG: type II toxin-antitoxin system VapC family toxin [Solirubrobacteraceae bacterium]